MASAFNLTAQLNLRGPSNIRNIVSDIRRQLGTVTGDINFRIDPATTRNVTQLNSAIQNLNRTLTQTRTLANNAADALRAFSAAANQGNIGNIANNINNVGRAAANAGQNTTRVTRQIAEARTEMEEFGRQSALAVRRFAAFSVSTGAIVALTGAIREGVQAYIAYDKELVKLQQVTDESAKGLQNLSNTITSLSTGLGVASSDLLQVSSTLAQAGLNAKDTERALKALALSALAPSFNDLNQTVEGSIALMRQFSISAKDLESSLGSINAVAAKFAVESSDIISAIQRTGGVFAAASKGVSEGKQALNEFIAVFTSVRATTRESAETIATGLRTIFTRIQRGSTIEALKEFGVTLTDAEGKFVGAYKAIQLLSEGLNRIDPRDLKFSQIVEELGGFRQIGKVIPLIQQFATAQQALSIAQKGAGSLTADAVTAQLSLANQISKVREEFLALFREIGSSDTFQTIAKGALGVASALIKVADSVKGVLPVLGIMLAMKGASAATQFGAGFIGGIRRGGGARGMGNRMAGGFAAGGMVPGSGNSDTVPAMLTPGEFVIRKKAVEKIGVGRLAALNRNQGGSIQYLNSGGVVQKFRVGGKATKKPLSDYHISHLGSTDSPLQSIETSSGKVFMARLLDNYTIALKTKFNQDLRDRVGRGVKPKDLLSYLQETPVSTLFASQMFGVQPGTNAKGRGGYGFISGVGSDIKQMLQKEFTGLAPLIKTAIVSSLARKIQSGQLPRKNMDVIFDSDLGFLKQDFKKIIDEKGSKALSQALARANEYRIRKKDNPQYAEYFGERSTLTRRLSKKSTLQARKMGGFIQEFMVGGTVRPTKTPSPQDLILGPGDKKTGWKQILTQIMSQNGIPYDGTTGSVMVNNQKISLKDIFSPRQLGSKNFRDKVGIANLTKLENLRSSVVEAYMGQRSGLAEGVRPRNLDEISAAKEKKLLFGVAGMYGKSFPPTLVKLGQADGLKEPVDVTVFGSTLNKNKAEKDQKIARIQNINNKRLAKGKTAIVDEAGMVDRLSAPTAESLSSQFGVKQAISGVARANKQLASDTVTAIAKTLSPASGGSKIFLDFDKTLAFGADKIAGKSSKKVKGKKSIQDFSAFGDLTKVDQGLKTAKLSNLGLRLINLVNKLDQQNPGSGNSLLQRMFVVSARPNNTMSLIAKWLNQRGLRIPTSNFRGVGGSSITPKQIAINKAEQMLALGAGKGSVFIDDDTRNVRAASKAGITSIQYGAKVDKKTKREAAQSEGLAYQDYIRKNLPANILKAMESESQSIDFPMGLGSRIATAWFNDPRLASIPVDTKRTLNGPRGKIKTNIINYLKAKGYNFGGFVQQFANGGLATSTAKAAILGKRRLNAQEMMKAAKKAGYDIERLDNGKIALSRQGKTYHTLTDDEASKMLGSFLTGYATGGHVQGVSHNFSRIKFASGGSVEDKVPALLTPGEFVINKKAAQKIGTSKLHRLNQADKIQGFNKGGMVGNIIKFRNGGPTPKGVGAPGGSVNLGIGDNIFKKYVSPADNAFKQVIASLNILSGGSLGLLRKGVENLAKKFNNEATTVDDISSMLFQIEKAAPGLGKALVANGQANKRSELAQELLAASIINQTRDLAKTKGTKAGTDFLTQTKTAIEQDTANKTKSKSSSTGSGVGVDWQKRAATAQTALESRARRFVTPDTKITTGNYSQEINKEVYALAKSLKAAGMSTKDALVEARKSVQSGGLQSPRAKALEDSIDQKQLTRTQRRASARGVGLTGGAIPMSAAGQRYAASVSGKPATNIFQSVTQSITTALQKVSTAITSGATSIQKTATSAGGGLGSGGSSFRQRARDLRNQGYRGQALRDQMGDGGGGMGSRMGMALGFAAPMIAEMFSTAKVESAQAARNNAQVQGIGTAVGSAGMLMSMGGPMGMIGGLAAGAVGLVKAFADGENAALEFSKQLKTDALETSLEKAGTAVEKFSTNLNDAKLESSAKSAVAKANKQAEDLATLNRTPTASVVGMVAKATGVESGAGEFERSQILANKGMMSYFSSLMGGQSATSNEFKSLIPQLAKENAKTFAGAAEASSSLLSAQFKSGKTVDSMAASGELQQFAKSLALADVAVQEQIMSIQNSTSLSESGKKAAIDNIVAVEAESKARDIQNRALKELAVEKLNKQITQLENSLERSFQNLEQSIDANAYSLSKLSDNAELAAASLSGNAKAGAVKLDSANILKNPRGGYSDKQVNSAIAQAASAFGSQASEMEGILKLPGKLEDSLMKTINTSIKSANAKGEPITQEAVGARMQSSVNQTLVDLQIPPELSSGLSREISTAITNMRGTGANASEQVDFTSLINEVPQLGKVLDSAKRAQELANKALEHWQSNLTDYANSMNSIVDAQIEINSRLRRSTDIMINGQLELNRAMGQTVSLQTTKSVSDQRIASQTGGLTNPNDIFNKIRDLEQTRQTQEGSAQAAAQKGPSGADEFMVMQDRLANTNVALRENYDALKQMADNTEVASAAMQRISELRQKTQAGANIAERLVTSSPRELQSLNKSMALLSNNMAGRTNMGTTAQDRKGSLDAFNMIAPFLGDRQDAMKANVLESMLKESGVGVNGMMQQVLDSLRNPESDPEMAAAVQTYKEAISIQSEANVKLAQLTEIMQSNNAEIAAEKLKSALVDTTFNFDTRTLLDIKDEIQNLTTVVKGNSGSMTPAQTKSLGGIIYASVGGGVNFKPKGTDTVPAMLTPGEFVVNRKATSKHLPLLKSINSGYMSDGGQVRYLQTGGLVFGGKWQKADRSQTDQLANEIKNRSNDDNFLKSTSTLSGLDWNTIFERAQSNQPLDSNKTLGEISNVPYFAGTTEPKNLLSGYVPTSETADSAGSISKSLFGSSLSSNGLLRGLSWMPGQYMDSFSIVKKKEGSSTAYQYIDPFIYTSIQEGPVKSFNGRPQPIEGVPDPVFAQKLLTDGISKGQIAFTKAQALKSITYLKSVLDNFPEITSDAGSISFDSKKYPISSSSDMASGSSPTASFNITPNKITVQGLTKQSTGGGILFNMEKFNSENILRAAGGAKNNNHPVIGYLETSIGRDLLNINTGLNNPSSVGSAFASILRGLPPDLDSAQAVGLTNHLTQLRSNLQAGLKIIEETVSKNAFSAAEAVKSAQTYSNKLTSLYGGALFSAVFNADEINVPDPNIKPPLTLYNLKQDQWAQKIAQLQDTTDMNSFAKTDGSNWIPIEEKDGPFGGGSPRSVKTFPWTDSTFSVENIKQLRDSTKEESERFVKDFFKIDMGRRFVSKNDPNIFNGASIDIPYKVITGQMWDKTLKTFDDKVQTFTVLDNVAGQILNPLSEFALDPTSTAIFAGYGDNIANFVKTLSDQYVNNQLLSFDTIAKVLPNSIADQGFQEPIKSNLYLKDLLAKQNLDPVKFREAQQKQKQQDQEFGRKDRLSKTVGAEQSKQLQNFSWPQRIALARAIHETARTNGLPMKIRKPISEGDVGQMRQYVGQAAQQIPQPDKRAQFKGIYNILGKVLDVNGDASYFTNNGINLTVADKNKRKAGLQGTSRRIRGQNQPIEFFDLDSAANKINKKALQNLIIRTGQIAMIGGIPGQAQAGGDKGTGGVFGSDTQLSTVDKYSIGSVLDGSKVMDVDPKTGKLTEKPFSKKIEETTYQDIFGLALNPYNLFANNTARGQLIDMLKTRIAENDPVTRRPLFRKKDLDTLNTNFDTLKTWYGTYQDYFVNNSNNSLENINNKIAELNNSKISEIDTYRNEAQKSNLLLTNNQFGELKNAQRLMDELTEIRDNFGKQTNPIKTQNKANGGLIYAANGALIDFKPKGTDTVPAMLTPGEFVVNRESTQKHLSLLQAINSNKYLSHREAVGYNRGGFIKSAYLSRGGMSGGIDYAAIGNLFKTIQNTIETAFTQAVNNIKPSNKENTGGVSNRGSDLGKFTDRLSQLIEDIRNLGDALPSEVRLTADQRLNVNVTGMSDSISSDPKLAEAAKNMIINAINQLSTNNPGTIKWDIDKGKL